MRWSLIRGKGRGQGLHGLVRWTRQRLRVIGRLIPLDLLLKVQIPHTLFYRRKPSLEAVSSRCLGFRLTLISARGLRSRRATFGLCPPTVCGAVADHADAGAMRMQLAVLFGLAAYLIWTTTFAGLLVGVIPPGH